MTIENLKQAQRELKDARPIDRVKDVRLPVANCDGDGGGDGGACDTGCGDTGCDCCTAVKK